jgi:hypothetical protein
MTESNLRQPLVAICPPPGAGETIGAAQPLALRAGRWHIQCHSVAYVAWQSPPSETALSVTWLQPLPIVVSPGGERVLVATSSPAAAVVTAIPVAE